MELGMAGFVVHWMKYYAQIGNDCLHPTVVYAGDVRKIEVLHMFGSYVVLGLGMLASLVIFFGEILYWKMIRPCLPEKWKTDSSTHDIYNKIFVGYGYSNVRPNTPAAVKKPPVPLSIAQTLKPPIYVQGQGNPNAANPTAAVAASTGPAPQAKTPQTGTSDNFAAGMYNPNYSANYNTRNNYNYYNFGQGNRQSTNFATKFGMNQN